MLERVFSGGKTEQRVIDNIKKHIRTLGSASDCFKRAIEGQDKDLMYCVSDLEREGDSIRREIISTIYEGAFLPFLRPKSYSISCGFRGSGQLLAPQFPSSLK